jgi:hypothetical protein
MARKVTKLFLNDLNNKLDEVKTLFNAFIDARIDARMEPIYKALGIPVPKPKKPK